MINKTETIIFEDVSVSYTYYQGGDPFLFLFHGFGQTPDIFTSVIPEMRASYSIIAFDLFKSLHNEPTAQDFISADQWNAIIEQLCKRYSIQALSVISFSMGTRFATSMLMQHAARIQRMVLIAPDGFGNTYWFRMATATYVTRKIFKAVMKYPVWIKRFAHMLYHIGLLNQITYRFVERNLETKSVTEKIYSTWVYVRKLGIIKHYFVSTMNEYGIKVLFVLGKYDQLVAAAAIKEMAISVHAQVIELESAHHKLVQAIDGREVKRFLVSDRK